MSERKVSGPVASDEPLADRILVALVEDNRLVRDGITTLLNRYPDIFVLADEPGDGVAWLLATRPHVVLIDLGLENADAVRLAKSVRDELPDARVIMMDLLPAEEDILLLVAAGVAGFIMKDATVEEVVATIRAVAAGEEVLPARITGTLFTEIAREVVSIGGTDSLGGAGLTPREQEVIGLISEGLSNKAIARRLEISPHTVKSHLRNIMDKLALHSRLELAVFAHGIDSDS